MSLFVGRIVLLVSSCRFPPVLSLLNKTLCIDNLQDPPTLSSLFNKQWVLCRSRAIIHLSFSEPPSWLRPPDPLNHQFLVYLRNSDFVATHSSSAAAAAVQRYTFRSSIPIVQPTGTVTCRSCTCPRQRCRGARAAWVVHQAQQEHLRDCWRKWNEY